MTSDKAAQKDLTSVRSQLWYALLDAERMSRFFAKVADRNRMWHTVLSIATMVASLSAGVTLLLPIDNVWSAMSTVILFLAVSTMTAVMIVFDFSGRAQAARIVADQVREICLELKQAWYRGPESNSQESISNLERRLDTIVRIDPTLDDKLDKQCAEDAYKVIQDELGRRGAGASVGASL